MKRWRAGMLPFLVLLLSLTLSQAALRINCGGPLIHSIGFRYDLTNYQTNSATSSVTLSASDPAVTSVKGSWAPVYQTYRYANSGDLQYKLPVPAGTYSVAMLFTETWEPNAKVGGRVFDIKINGKVMKKSVDVFAAVGFKKALYVRLDSVKAVNGFITVTMARIQGKENPMMSGLVITGDGADPTAKIGSEGFDSDAPPTKTAPTTQPPSSSGDPTCATGIFAKNTNANQMACCPKVCGKCGGKGCSQFAPGNLCCISNVYATGLSCDTNKPPCIPSQDLSESPTTPVITPTPTVPPPTTPVCAKGVLGYNQNTGQAACCEDACGKCGGTDCNKFAAGKICCISSVNAVGKSCDSNNPPCVPSMQPVDGTTPPTTTAPTTGSCAVSGASANAFQMNVAGGAIAEGNIGADNEDYIISKSKGLVFDAPAMKISAQSGPSPYDDAFSSHRWTKSSVLKYKIPVPAGKYTVKLLFAETYFTKPGQRTFDVVINGAEKEKDLDVLKAVGKDVGHVVSYENISPTAGGIAVTLIKSVENPMISGIIVEGSGAGSKAVGGGCSTTGKTKEDELDGGFDHRAHSVPGGPYVAVDFDNDGRASVSFDGTQSHSHYQNPGPPEVTGKILSYKWTWTETVDGKEVKKSNNDKSGKFTASFPIGMTIVTLEVVDNTGDVSSDTVVVEVKGSTTNGAYCYYYDYEDSFFATVPIKEGLDSNPKPTYGAPSGTINFNSQKDFGSLPFASNAFAVRCSFFIDVPKDGAYSYTVKHEGPFKLYHEKSLMSQSNSKGTTKSPSKNLKAGLNTFQLLYFRPKNVVPSLVLSDDSGPLSSATLQHDSSATLPVITGLSKSSSTPAGGQNIQIFGSAFMNGLSVHFGDVEATNLIASDVGSVQVTVPPGSGAVPVTVKTNAGVSNEVTFTYTSEDTLNQPVIFKETKLKGTDGNTFKISFIAAATYGPDGRLYLGSTASKVYALSIDKDYKVQATCEKVIGTKRAVLGVAFNPFKNDLKMYFTTNTLYWKDKNLHNFEEGWTNGKIETIDFSATQLSGGSCAFNQGELVTGLPVSNHDHGVNKLQFLPTGELLVGVGGFTNGGISIPGKKPVPNDAKDDLLGGVASNPLSAAIVSCPWNKKTDIKYDNYADPEKAKVISGDCKVYASGFRNSFGMTLHSNGHLYATDNGPNAGFGDFSTNCNGGVKKGENLPDKLFKVAPGKFHGHANLNRKECENYPASAVQPIIPNLKSSSNGIIEYRSNTFGGEIKSFLYMSKFSVQNAGLVAQLQVGADGGNAGYAPNFLSYSGLSLVEGPRGELVMPRVYQAEVVLGYPSYKVPDVTFMIGVHPKQGPASGGTKVQISGHNFGSSPTATFGGTPCTKVVVVDDDTFTCITPAKPKNTQVAVVVKGATGESPSYGTDYWYF